MTLLDLNTVKFHSRPTRAGKVPANSLRLCPLGPSNKRLMHTPMKFCLVTLSLLSTGTNSLAASLPASIIIPKLFAAVSAPPPAPAKTTVSDAVSGTLSFVGYLRAKEVA